MRAEKKRKKSFLVEAEKGKDKYIKTFILRSDLEVEAKKRHETLKTIRFVLKSQLYSFLSKAWGGVSEKTVHRYLRETNGAFEIKKDYTCGRWCIDVSKKARVFKKMNNYASILLKTRESFRHTQNLAESELRLDVEDQTLLVYLENCRRQVIHQLIALKKEGEEMLWEPYLYVGQDKMAFHLGWTLDKVRYHMDKLRRYFGPDFFRPATLKEKAGRRHPDSHTFQINIPPISKWDAIIMKKIALYVKLKGESALKKKYDKKTFDRLKSIKKARRKKIYMEAKNPANKEYERLTKLIKSVNSMFLQMGKITKSDYIDLVFDRTSRKYLKDVPSWIKKKWAKTVCAA